MTTILGSVLYSTSWLHGISQQSKLSHQWYTSISNDKKGNSAISVMERASKAEPEKIPEEEGSQE